MKKRTVSIVMFDDVEVLDFAGPFEVFSVCKNRDEQPLFDVSTVAVNNKTIKARNGLQITTDYTLSDITKTDILLVPGGMGTRTLINHEPLISWIKKITLTTELTLSVCTGALLLAKAGLLQNAPATTHHAAFNLLQATDPSLKLIKDQRFVDNTSLENNRIITSGGISAGIDMSFHVLEKLHGKALADATASYMEYRRI